jgi:hypothetical protein
MNNIRTLIAIAAVFIAATLVVGGTSATITTTHSAFAWKKDGQDKYMKGGEQDGYKKDRQDKKGRQANGEKDNGSNNGNTNTVQVLKQNAKASGKHSEVDQNGQNVICTHPTTTSPASGASCVRETEGAANGGGGGVCSSPLVEAHVGSATGDLICVDPSDLNPTNGQSGKCGGNEIDVFVDSTHLCLPTKAA